VPARPPFKICVPPLHVWSPGCCMHPILYLKNAAPHVVFGPLLRTPGDGPAWGIVLWLLFGKVTFAYYSSSSKFSVLLSMATVQTCAKYSITI